MIVRRLQGGFAEFVAVIASCSALAAIMSTCDSTIIGANNVVTVELVQNWLWKGATHKQLEYFSMAFTPVFAALALVSFTNYFAVSLFRF